MREYRVDIRWSKGSTGWEPEWADAAPCAYAARWIDNGNGQTADVVHDRMGYAADCYDYSEQKRLIQMLERDQPHTWACITAPGAMTHCKKDGYDIAIRREGGYFYVEAWLRPTEESDEGGGCELCTNTGYLLNQTYGTTDPPERPAREGFTWLPVQACDHMVNLNPDTWGDAEAAMVAATDGAWIWTGRTGESIGSDQMVLMIQWQDGPPADEEHEEAGPGDWWVQWPIFELELRAQARRDQRRRTSSIRRRREGRGMAGR